MVQEAGEDGGNRGRAERLNVRNVCVTVLVQVAGQQLVWR